MALPYRPEVDGLRAIAVLGVLLFHAGVAPLQGGFVGVDVFFVISGYLITSQVRSDLRAGRFSLAGFWERRARRILPALLLVALCSVPMAVWLAPPDELERFGKSLVAVALFVSNVLFWTESGYFGTAAETKPLLHTWSLAVEEQFYLAAPLLLLATARWRPRLLAATLSLLLALSLGISVWATRHTAAAGFYLSPARAWELLSGALLALHAPMDAARPSVRANWRECGAMVGLLLVAGAMVGFDRSTPFPGWLAAVPVGGTALLIASTQGSSRVGRLLGLPPLVAIGRISYSTYLWHQPLLAASRMRQVEAPTQSEQLACIIAALLLGAVSWRWVEQPFRDRTRIGRAALVKAMVGGSLLVVALGVALDLARGLPERVPIDRKLVDSFARTPRESDCFNLPRAHEAPRWYCVLGADGAVPNMFVLGDSHALSMLPALDEALRLESRAAWFVAPCPPLLGVHPVVPQSAGTDCAALNQRVLDFVRKHRPRQVVLMARWAFYTDGGHDGRNWRFLDVGSNGRADPGLSRAAFLQGLRSTVTAYRALGVPLVLVAQVPEQRHDARTLYFRTVRDHGGIPPAALDRYAVTPAEHRRLQAWVREAMSRYQQQPGVTVLSLDDVYCDPGRCPIGSTDASRYHDDNHLSETGARLAVPALRQAFGATPQ